MKTVSSYSVKDFDELVKTVEDDNSVIPANYLTDGVHENFHQSIQQCINIACELFIRSNGTPNYPNITDSRYKIKVGESDTCGVLSMVIHTSRGKIVFG